MIRAGRCWASTEVSRMLAKTATKEPELLDGFNLEETLMTETTIDGEVMKESIIGEVGGHQQIDLLYLLCLTNRNPNCK